MAAYSIIRIKKLKSWGAVAGAVAHNARTRETLNADPGIPCRFLIGSPHDDPVAVCKARLGDQKIRKNAVYGVDGFLGASPEYFRPDAPAQYGLVYAERLNVWVETSVAWLQDRYDDRVINAVLHLDEATPHIQYLLLPLDDKGKLNYKSLFGGSKYVLSQLQSDYANAVAHLGLTRGREGSKAKHTEVAEYYARTQRVEHTAIPQLPSLEDIQPPEPPSTMARMKTENLIAYAKDAAVTAVREQMARLEPALAALVKQNDLLTTENARLREEREQLKNSNSQLCQENADFKTVANQMRELNLDQVLVKMYGATEALNSTPKSKTRTFALPDGLSIEYSDNQWQSRNGRKGKGAINLVMYLSGYGQDHYQQAVRDMAEIFGDKDIIGSLANYMVDSAPQHAHRISRQNFQMPEPCKGTWPDVRDHLVNKMKLPPAFIDKLHEDGLIFSDQRLNCVFPRDKASGVFKIGSGAKPFSQTLGKDGEAFVMHGTDNKLYIVDSPMEALSLKLMHPDSTILATGGFMQAEKVKPYIGQKEVFISQGQAGIAKEVSKFFRDHIPNAKLIQPNMGKSWHECRLLRIEEEEKKRRQQAQAAAQARAQTFTATQIINRSDGMGMGR